MTAIRLISFGYLHSGPPTANLVLDVRSSLRDPAAARDVLDLDGRDKRVQHIVMNNRGAWDTVRMLGSHALRLTDDSHPATTCTVAIGCAGGRHRSVALVEVLAACLYQAGVYAGVTHCHVHLPRVPHSANRGHHDLQR